MFMLVSAMILSTVTEALQVIGGNKMVAQGGTVVLPCKLIDTRETLSQISWQRMTRGKPWNANFFTILPKDGPKFVNGGDKRFKFIGSFNDSNGSLQLSNVTLMDEGTYTCIFTLFPSGNHQTEIPLNVLVPPVSSLEANPPVLGDKEVSLVTCTAAGSKPPAEVRWQTGDLADKLRATTNSIEHDNGTTTTISSLFGIPSREINRHLVEWVVTNAAMEREQTLPFTIEIYFAPTEVNIHGQPSGLFECATEANPDAKFTWSRFNNPWPQSAVRVEGATLQFLSMTSDLNGLYQCEASNPYGTKRGHFYLHVHSGGCAVGWTLFSLLLILNVAAAALQRVQRCPSASDSGVRPRVQRIPSTSDSGVRRGSNEFPAHLTVDYEDYRQRQRQRSNVKSWPQSAVRVEAATLQFLSMTSDLSGLYQREAWNPYGPKRGHLYLPVHSGSQQDPPQSPK